MTNRQTIQGIVHCFRRPGGQWFVLQFTLTLQLCVQFTGSLLCPFSVTFPYPLFLTRTSKGSGTGQEPSKSLTANNTGFPSLCVRCTVNHMTNSMSARIYGYGDGECVLKWSVLYEVYFGSYNSFSKKKLSE